MPMRSCRSKLPTVPRIYPSNSSSGWLREDADRAAGRVAAEQGPLRPAQHFDAVDVEHPQHRAAGARHIDAVDVEADAALAGRAAAAGNAADGEVRGVVAVAARGGNGQVRREDGEVLEVLDPLRRDHFLGHRHDRKRRVLQVGRAPLGRDDDFPEAAFRTLVGGRISLRAGFLSVRGSCCQRDRSRPRKRSHPQTRNGRAFAHVRLPLLCF